jgi:thiamine biosynthesis lipoprotein
MMGTFVEVVSPDRRAARIVFDELVRIENLLSKYKPQSEISRLNQAGKIEASGDTAYVLRKAKEFWLISNGAFDITVGPLMDLWGFTDKNYRVPGDEEIRAVAPLIGMDKIIFHENRNMVELKTSGMKIDLGAIAKGYAVDCAAARLKEKKVRSCLINAGGDIFCLGDKFGKPWKVAIQDPREDNFLNYIELKDRAVATSGDYRQYFIKNKKRYSHIFNLKTGYPAETGVVSATVVAPDCLTADALATTIFVLGKAKGLELVKKFADVQAKVIDQKDLLEE